MVIPRIFVITLSAPTDDRLGSMITLGMGIDLTSKLYEVGEWKKLHIVHIGVTRTLQFSAWSCE